MLRSTVFLLALCLLADAGYSASYNSIENPSAAIVGSEIFGVGSAGISRTVGQVFRLSAPDPNDPGFGTATAANVTGFSFRADDFFGKGVSYIGYLAEWSETGGVGAIVGSELFRSSAQTAPNGPTVSYVVDTSSEIPAVEFGTDYVAFITTVGVTQTNAFGGGFSTVYPLAHVYGTAQSSNGKAVTSSATSINQLFGTGGFQRNARLDFDLLVSYEYVAGASGGDPDPEEPYIPLAPDPDPDSVPVADPDIPPIDFGDSPEPASCLMWAVLGCTGLMYGWRGRRRRGI